MAMKLKSQEDEDVPEEERPVPHLKQRPLSELFHSEAQRSFLECLFSSSPSMGSYPKQASPAPSPAEEPPFEPDGSPPDNVIPLHRGNSSVETANDDSYGKRKRRRKGGGTGGNDGGGSCQATNISLKAWLAAFCPIPNNVCWLKDKAKHVAATENSRKMRLMKYGYSDCHSEQPPEWVKCHKVEGWYGARVPSVQDLFSNSKKIAEKLGPLELDKETKSFFQEHAGEVFTAPLRNDIHDQMLQEVSIEQYDAYLAVMEQEIFLSYDPERELRIPGNRSSSVHEPEKIVENSSNTLPVVARVKTVGMMGNVMYEPAKVRTLYQRTFTDERKSLRRAQRATGMTPISYRDISSPVYDVELDAHKNFVNSEIEDLYRDPVHRELAHFCGLGRDEEESETVVRVEDLSSTGLFQDALKFDDAVKCKAWLRLKDKHHLDTGNQRITGAGRQPSFFSLKGSKTDESERLDYWLGVNDHVNELHNCPEGDRYHLYWGKVWHRDESARLSEWLLTHPSSTCYYVPSEQEEESAKDQMMVVHDPRHEPCSGTRREQELLEWAELASDDEGIIDAEFEEIPTPKDPTNWIVPPEEINELIRLETSSPLIPHNDEIVERIAEASIRRLEEREKQGEGKTSYLALKRGFKNLTKSLVGKKVKESRPSKDRKAG